MFQKPLVIMGLKRQQKILCEQIRRLSEGPFADDAFYASVGQIAANLRRLRMIRRTYAIYMSPAGFAAKANLKEHAQVFAEQ